MEVTTSAGLQAEDGFVKDGSGGRSCDKGAEAEGMRAPPAKVGMMIEGDGEDGTRTGTGGSDGESKGGRGEVEDQARSGDGGGSQSGETHEQHEGSRVRWEACGGK